MTTTAPPIVLNTFADAHEAYRNKDLRQALYDAGEVVMSGVLVNLHGEEHRNRRRVENRMFRREVFEAYERELFPQVTAETLASDLERLKRELGVDLSLGELDEEAL